MTADAVTFGEAMVRLSPPAPGYRLPVPAE